MKLQPAKNEIRRIHIRENTKKIITPINIDDEFNDEAYIKYNNSKRCEEGYDWETDEEKYEKYGIMTEELKQKLTKKGYEEYIINKLEYITIRLNSIYDVLKQGSDYNEFLSTNNDNNVK